MYNLIYDFLENYIFNGLNDFTLYSYGFRNGDISTTLIEGEVLSKMLCSIGSIVGVVLFLIFIVLVCRYIFRLVGGLMSFRR